MREDKGPRFQAGRSYSSEGKRWCDYRLGIKPEHGEIERTGMGMDDESLQLHSIGVAAAHDNDAEPQFDIGIKPATVRGDQVVDSD